MKYTVTIGGEAIEVELDTGTDGPPEAAMIVDGRRCRVRLRTVAAGVLLAEDVATGARLEIVCLDTPNDDHTRIRLLAPPNDVEVRAESERDRLRKMSTAGDAGARSSTMRSQLPGVIRRVLCTEGDEVAAGEALLTLEAMKMENELVAEHAGTVTRIHVADGDVVRTGEPLLELRGAAK